EGAAGRTGLDPGWGGGRVPNGLPGRCHCPRPLLRPRRPGELGLDRAASDQVDAIVIVVTGDGVQERPVGPRPAQPDQLALERGQPLDAVAERGGILEVEPGRGFIHPAPEDRDRVIGIAFQETAGEVDALEVLGLRAAPGAGREAASDLAAVAERRVALLEELELIGEPDRRRGATVAELQEVGELPDRLADPGPPTERAEVERAVPGDIAHDEEAGRSGAGDLDEAELP